MTLGSVASQLSTLCYKYEVTAIYEISYAMILVGTVTFIVLTFITPAPYGRYSTSSFGWLINARFAWLTQELPAFSLPILLIFCTDLPPQNLVNNILLTLFICHYFQRTFVYSLLIKGGKPTPVLTYLLALTFCLVNGYVHGRYLTRYAVYADSWITCSTFLPGVALFVIGFTINIHSDHILRSLRKPGETGYKIPRGGLFEYVTGANFFGEILEWAGFAVACWSLPALAFFIFTACNLTPRALHHHRYYLSKFDDYPSYRKILIPWIW